MYIKSVHFAKTYIYCPAFGFVNSFQLPKVKKPCTIFNVYSTTHKATSITVPSHSMALTATMEKCPLTVNGSWQPEWSLKTIPAGGRQSNGSVNSIVSRHIE